MKKQSYSSRVWKIIKSSDIVLEILDARFCEETRNPEFEKAILGEGKKLILVLNKSDLVPKSFAERRKKELLHTAPCIFVSSKEKSGKYLLRKAILRMAKGNGTIGVVGYPNTGKSSVINALSGRKATKTSSTAGFTRGEQKVRLREGIYLIDSPGIIPFGSIDEEKLLILNAKSPEQVGECTGAAEKILEMASAMNPKAINERYKVNPDGSGEKMLREIALRQNRRSKGGGLDIESAAKQVVLDWQRGKIRLG